MIETTSQQARVHPVWSARHWSCHVKRLKASQNKW